MQDAPNYWPKPHRIRPRRAVEPPASEAARPPAGSSPQSLLTLPFALRMPRYLINTLQFSVATIFSFLVPCVLAKLGLARSLGDEMTAVGFDTVRVQLIDYALIALVGAIGAGILLRRYAPVWLGALLYYVVLYLAPFIIQAQRPPLAPDGTPQVLVPGALASTVATLFAAGVIFSGAGAVLGEACGRVFVAPLITLSRLVLTRVGLQQFRHVSRRAAITAVFALVLGGAIATALMLVASNVDTILNYGTFATIYRPAQIPKFRGAIELGSYPSPALFGVRRQFLIYLPPSYSTSPARRYPVIYLLHGNPGKMTNWFAGAHADTTANVLITTKRAGEAILVAPDGNGSLYEVSEWANSFDGRQQMEDSVAYDLVHYIDTHYRTLADPTHRAIAGISEGGFAAANIALHHPDIFGTAFSLGGFFVANANSPVFGAGQASIAYRQYNSPALYVRTPSGAEAAHAIKFIIGVGTQDRQYFPLGIAYYKELRQLGMQATLLETPGGHSWPLWSLQFAQALPMIVPPETRELSAPRPPKSA